MNTLSMQAEIGFKILILLNTVWACAVYDIYYMTGMGLKKGN